MARSGPGTGRTTRSGSVVAPGALRTVPLAGETTASLINRAAARYGLPAGGMLGL